MISGLLYSFDWVVGRVGESDHQVLTVRASLGGGGGVLTVSASTAIAILRAKCSRSDLHGTVINDTLGNEHAAPTPLKPPLLRTLEMGNLPTSQEAVSSMTDRLPDVFVKYSKSQLT